MTEYLRKRERRSTRLPSYDYSLPGGYLVTMCIQNRECLLGEVIEGEMRTNHYGQIVQWEWLRTAELRQEVALDAFQVMPIHFHAIVIISEATPMQSGHGRAPSSLSRSPKSPGSLVAGFKSVAAKRINDLRGTPGSPVWHCGYYERVIRNERELDAIRQYIVDNPLHWDLDKENPEPSR